MGAMVDIYCASYATSPAAVTLDIDDTVDVVHGHKQLSLFNAHWTSVASCRSILRYGDEPAGCRPAAPRRFALGASASDMLPTLWELQRFEP
jgi:Transposase DDE domain group 1